MVTREAKERAGVLQIYHEAKPKVIGKHEYYPLLFLYNNINETNQPLNWVRNLFRDNNFLWSISQKWLLLLLTQVDVEAYISFER